MAPSILPLRHPNKYLLLSEGEHRAALCALQVHDDAGAVLQSQITAPRAAKTGLTGALRVSPGKIGDTGKLVYRARCRDFRHPAAGAGDGSDNFERVCLALEIERTVAATQAGDKVLGDRHLAGRR